jgi:hypothetical protein
MYGKENLMIDQLHFEVGEKYENMKGVFEVIAIHRDSMEIRWENGEEISTPIALQQRIIERMQHEKELEQTEAGKKAKKTKARSSRSATPFAGLEDGDFATSVAKTVWRGRGQLGGAVARQMKHSSFKFNSWAVLSQPEVHWLDVKRQKQDTLPSQAKFYVLIGQASLGFGLTLPQTEASPSTAGDWQRLLGWIEQPQNDGWFKDLCTSEGLYLYDTNSQGVAGTIEAREQGWIHRKPDGQESDIRSLAAFLAAIDSRAPMDLRIEKRMKKSVAIDKGAQIAAELADLFTTLMPLYRAAAMGTA